MNGKKNGKGVLKFEDGSCYDGFFVDNNLSGLGVYHWPDGREYEGE